MKAREGAALEPLADDGAAPVSTSHSPLLPLEAPHVGHMREARDTIGWRGCEHPLADTLEYSNSPVASRHRPSSSWTSPGHAEPRPRTARSWGVAVVEDDESGVHVVSLVPGVPPIVLLCPPNLRRAPRTRSRRFSRSRSRRTPGALDPGSHHRDSTPPPSVQAAELPHSPKPGGARPRSQRVRGRNALAALSRLLPEAAARAPLRPTSQPIVSRAHSPRAQSRLHQLLEAGERVGEAPGCPPAGGASSGTCAPVSRRRSATSR